LKRSKRRSPPPVALAELAGTTTADLAPVEPVVGASSRGRRRSRLRGLITRRRAVQGGFGLALFFVPGLSFLCLPWLVTSGTLLVLELGPPE